MDINNMDTHICNKQIYKKIRKLIQQKENENN